MYVHTIDVRLSREQRKHSRCCYFHKNDPNLRNLQNIEELKITTYKLSDITSAQKVDFLIFVQLTISGLL